VKHRLAVLHVNDIRRAGQFEPVVAGSGVVPLEAIFREVQAAGFDGWISVEEASRSGEAGFRQAIPYVEQLWRRVGGAPRSKEPAGKGSER
jgi:sugar phosphate isomerase/epimerase